jgi:tetratricopeptide (TPR) repeat protein
MRAVSQHCIVAARLVLLLLFSTAVEAAPQNLAALRIYERGDYVAAAKAAEREGGGEGFALAARSILADATLREQPCMECLKQAEDFARRAIAADANYAEGYIELAAALGYEARLMGLFRAKVNRLGEQAKDAIDTALKLTPDEPWALAAAGGWNIEVVRLGGRVVGGMIYGAHFDDGVAYYRRALSADPNNLVISLQYVLALTSYAFEARRLEIMAVLDAVVRAKPPDAYSDAMRERAMRLLDLLNRNKREEYLALANRYLGIQ